MSLNISIPKTVELKPRIVVIGVGGAGGNAVNNMIASGLDGVEFIVANTDAQALEMSSAQKRVRMGTGITQGLGAGMRPEIGEGSAEESLPEIMEHLDGAHMLFVAAGMGGGTGTGAAPVIAQAAREKGILTVAIVTKPFEFEGSKRMKLANEGVEKLYNSVDTLITIPNQNLFRVATNQTTMSSAFALADQVLHSGVKGVTDLMVVPGLINLDFNDVRTVMDEMGKAMMGTGEATGENRAVEAAESAISNPLLDDVSLKGAKGVLINITGGEDLTLFEVHEAATLIRSQVDEDANIIVGSALDNDLDGIIRVSVVATGVEASEQQAPVRPQSDYTARRAPAADQFTPPMTTAAPAAAAPLAAKYSSRDLSDELPPLAAGSDIAPPPMPSSSYESARDAGEPAREASRETSREPSRETSIKPAPQPLAAPIAEREYAAPVAARPVAPAPMPQPSPVQPAPTPQTQLQTSEPQRVIKRPFRDFFRNKKSLPIARDYQVQAKPQNTGDLFGADLDDELEIPAFLLKAKS